MQIVSFLHLFGDTVTALSKGNLTYFKLGQYCQELLKESCTQSE